jgi:hypothetical protein
MKDLDMPLQLSFAVDEWKISGESAVAIRTGLGVCSSLWNII